MALPFPACPGPMDRREWLRIGGLSLGALSTGLPPLLGDVLQAQAASPTVDRDFSVILFWANGGPSHLDLFDLKPEAPAEIRGPFQPIATNVPGMEITEELPLLARVADKFTLIRSLHHERNEHSGGTHRFLTGYASRAANLQNAEYPELGSVVTKCLNRSDREIPFFVANTKFYGGGPAYLGPSCSPYMPNPDPRTSTGNNTYDPIALENTGGRGDVLSLSPEGVLNLRRRANLLESLDGFRRDVERGPAVESLGTFQSQALGMLASPRTRDAFDLARESAVTRQRYGDTHTGRSLLVCRRLVEAGVRFVQCQANYRLKPETGRTSNWDDHSVNSHIFNAYREKLPSLDQAMSALVQDLSDRGLNRHVLFLFCGEFGRTPTIRNQDPSGRPGRDHWSRAMSVFAAGGGLQMGQVIGSTNAKAEEPLSRGMDSNCLLATIYARFGIDTARTFPDESGRPHPILPSGEPIRELL